MLKFEKTPLKGKGLSGWRAVGISQMKCLGLALPFLSNEELKIALEADVNFSKVFGLSEDMISEKVHINLAAKSDATEAEIKRLENLAARRSFA